MDGEWFTKSGESGTLRIESVDGSWFVATPGKVGATQCIFDEELQFDESRGRQEIEVIVSNFRWGVKDNPNMVWIEPANGILCSVGSLGWA